MKINIITTRDTAVIPKRSTDFAGGWDITAAKIEKVNDNLYIVYTGLKMQPPSNYKITLVPRSSFTNTNWVLQNSPGLGDSDYQGEYLFKFRAIPTNIKSVWNEEKNKDSYVSFLETKLTYDDFPYNVGDRIGQMYLEEVVSIEFELVDNFDNVTERNEAGFGSSGK
jgi:dUTPase